MQASGHPHDQAVAAALNVARKHRDSGGQVTKHHTGPIHSSVAGRTDHLPLTVPSGSYVIPADIVSGMGEGNTIAGFKHLRRMFGGTPYKGGDSPYGQSGSPYGMATGGKVKHRAAGILFITPEDKILLMRRAGKDHVGEWALPAGGIEKGETPEQAARRETEEEAGYKYDGKLEPLMKTGGSGVDFTTFTAHSKEFDPKLNDEHDGYVWINPDEAKKELPLHPGVRTALSRLRSAKANGGSSSGVQIVAAGGEHVLSPDQVRMTGEGDLDTGHKVLDEFVKRMRKELVKTLSKLPGPRRD